MRRIALLCIVAGVIPAALGAQRDTVVMFRGSAQHTGVSTARLFAGQGGIKWQTRTGDAVRSTPAVTARRIFVGSDDGSLYALDRTSGAVVWRFAAGGPVSASPAVARGLVVAATLDGRFFAVDERTGALRWSIRTGPALPLNTAPAGAWDLYASSPTVVGDTIVIGGQDGGIYALDLRTGKQRWRVQTGGRVRATPAIHDGVVVVGSWDGRLYARELATGRERWTHRTIGDTLDSKKFGFDRRTIQSSAAIEAGMVFVGSRDGGLYGVDFATGERRWRFSHRGSWVVGSPAVRDGRVYVGSSDGQFFQAVDAASGNELWRLSTRANVISSPILVGNTLLVGVEEGGAYMGEVLAIDAAEGKVRWRLRLPEAVWSSPVVADGEVYVGCDDGSIIAIHEVSRQVPHLAVFYDSTLAFPNVVSDGRFIFDYFRGEGYEPLGSDSLATFLASRVRDGAPSVVVFATGDVPRTVAPVMADTVLVRRYLDAGGKIVFLGRPMGVVLRDSTGKAYDLNFKSVERLLGVPAATFDYDPNTAHPTTEGKRWGLTRWVRGNYPVAASAVSKPLATDRYGLTTAWVKAYRRDRPGTGYVQLWGMGATPELLPVIRAVAEYGILRRTFPEGREGAQ